MKSVKLEIAEREEYSEAYQSTATRFSFLTKLPKAMGFKELHSGVKCRDFLGDVLFSEEQAKDINIYSFKWGKARPPISRDMTRFSIHFPSKDAAFNFKANSIILTDVEKGAGVKPSIIHAVDGNDLCVIIEADKVWQSSVFLISLFTFLLKIMGYSYKQPHKWLEEFPTLGKNDSPYYNGRKKELVKVLLNINKFANPKTVSGWLAEKDDYEVHNETGFSSMLRNYKKIGKNNSNAFIIQELMG